MSLKQAREEYERMKKSGDLEDMFPMLCGDWEEDKEFFLDMFYLNNDALHED